MPALCQQNVSVHQVQYKNHKYTASHNPKWLLCGESGIENLKPLVPAAVAVVSVDEAF